MILNKHRFSQGILAGLILIHFLSPLCHPGVSGEDGSDEWFQYRGPNRDGVALSNTPLKAWPKGNSPSLLWKRPLGEGFSGIVTAGDFLITAFGGEKTEFIGAFDRASGKEVWRTPLGEMFNEEMGNGPRCTPTIDGDLAYMLDSTGGLFAVNIETGKMIWKVSLTEFFKIQRPLRGFSTSPIVVGDTLILHGGGKDSAFIGLNKKTGETIWQAGESIAGHSSPFRAVINGVDQLVFTIARIVEKDGERKVLEEAVSVSPAGEILWRGPSLSQIIAMPVFVPPDKVFISSSVENGCLLIQALPGGKVETVWQNKEMRNHFNSSVYYKGHIYGFSSSTLKCLVADTAERKWSKRGYGKGSLIIADDKLIVLSDQGKLAMIEASPEGFKELSQAQVINGKSWTCPTIADGKIYLRNLKEMACYDLTK